MQGLEIGYGGPHIIVCHVHSVDNADDSMAAQRSAKRQVLRCREKSFVLEGLGEGIPSAKASVVLEQGPTDAETVGPLLAEG